MPLIGGPRGSGERTREFRYQIAGTVADTAAGGCPSRSKVFRSPRQSVCLTMIVRDASARGLRLRLSERVVRAGEPARSFSTPRGGLAAFRFPVRHDVSPWNQGSGAIDLDDHAAQADMDAHGAMNAIGQDGRRIGNVPTMRLHRAASWRHRTESDRPPSGPAARSCSARSGCKCMVISGKITSSST